MTLRICGLTCTGTAHLLGRISGETHGNTPFTSEEQKDIEQRLRKVEAHVRATYSLSEPEVENLHRKINYLIEHRQALSRFPRETDYPVFAEPWEAQAFALAVKLSEQGHFTWKEWAAALADEIQAASSGGEPDDGSRYYHHWLAALERLVMAKGLADSAALVARKEAWAEAYRRTPHGKPIELDTESSGGLHQG